MSLTVNVLFFARLREALATDQLRVTLPAGATASSLIDQLAAKGPEWQILQGDQPVMIAINQAMARLNHPLQNDDEVALFPPVTGG